MRKKLTLLRVCMICTLVLFCNLLSAQQKSITGKVTNSTTGEPVSNSTIVVKGSTVGTQTDAAGNFTIAVPNANSKLVVSSVGYEPQEISVTGKDQIAVSLKTTTSTLSEVVVTGYTSQRKKDITGSVAVVNVSNLKQIPTGNVSQALQGQASGVTILLSLIHI